MTQKLSGRGEKRLEIVAMVVEPSSHMIDAWDGRRWASMRDVLHTSARHSGIDRPLRRFVVSGSVAF